MTNFIKLNIEKEIKNNAGELQGFEWEEVYVNIDNISHFKAVDNKFKPQKTNMKKILFAASEYMDDEYYSSYHLKKYLSKSDKKDAFLDGEFSKFIQEVGMSQVSVIFKTDIVQSFEAIEVYFKAGVHPLGSSYNGEPVISCCGLKELKILVPKVAQSKEEQSKEEQSRA